MGPRGSGVSTQITKLCDKYRFSPFEIKNAYVDVMLKEKEERKRKRLLARGFKPPLPPEEEGEAPPPDPEIEEDPEDFDKAVHEKQLFNQLLQAEEATVYDLDWFDIPEEGAGAVATPISELLFESRRPPEVVVELKVSQQKMLERLLDKDGIQA